MFNKCVFIGNLSKDLELRYSQGGSAVCSTAIAVNRKWKDSTVALQDDTCFVDIVFFGRSAEVAHQYLRKGSKVLIEGRLKQDNWTDQNGQKRSKHSIAVESMQMLDTKNNNANEQKTDVRVPANPPTVYEQVKQSQDTYSDEDIPF